jgi:hypothetical protein
LIAFSIYSPVSSNDFKMTSFAFIVTPPILTQRALKPF